MQDWSIMGQRAVDEAILARRSVRAFKATPVGRTDIEDVLRVAGRAPSGSNSQPWQVYVLTGAARDGLSRALLEVYDDPVRRERETEEYAYYPTRWVSPFLERRRKVGWDMYTRSEEHTSELQSLMRNSYAVFC